MAVDSSGPKQDRALLLMTRAPVDHAPQGFAGTYVCQCLRDVMHCKLRGSCGQSRDHLRTAFALSESRENIILNIGPPNSPRLLWTVCNVVAVTSLRFVARISIADWTISYACRIAWKLYACGGHICFSDDNRGLFIRMADDGDPHTGGLATSCGSTAAGSQANVMRTWRFISGFSLALTADFQPPRLSELPRRGTPAAFLEPRCSSVALSATVRSFIMAQKVGQDAQRVLEEMQPSRPGSSTC